MTDHKSQLRPVMISALQHAVYCMRQAALIHLEQVWAENVLTTQGQIVHAQVDEVGHRTRKGVKTVTALPLESVRYGLIGKADVVEFATVGDRYLIHPVEYKRGQPKLHRADEVQLCAQALCLEEMFDTSIPDGSLFYDKRKRRTIVPFDEDLRALTINTALEFREVLRSSETPAPTKDTNRCKQCSLEQLCRPKLYNKKTHHWALNMAHELLTAEV